MTREIPLTCGLVALVDDEDYDEIARHKWYALRRGYRYYATRRVWVGINKSTAVFMHSVILGNAATSHVNDDNLDNRRSNLVPLNVRWRRSTAGSSSRFKGVAWVSGRGKWRARIRSLGGRDSSRQIFLGDHVVEEDAAIAYDRAVREMFGKFGAYNFPEHGERSALE